MSAHPHQHSVRVRASGASLDHAVAAALDGLSDPSGHHGGIAFTAFEVIHIGGVFVSGAPRVDVTLEAFGSHK